MDKKICIIVGHGKSKSGGYDSGAVSRDGKHHEFTLAKQIAKYVADYLGCSLMNFDGSLYLTDRIKEINRSDYDFIAEIHLNAGGGKGTEVYYYDGSPTGLKAAKAVSQEIANEFNVPDRGAKVRLGKNGKDYFAIIRDTKPTAILVETLFIDNEAELALLKTSDGQKRCGEAIGRGLEKALGTRKTAQTDIEITTNSLYIRSGAGTKNKAVGVVKKGEIHGIVSTDAAEAWGRLDDGRGWISLNPKYVKKI